MFAYHAESYDPTTQIKTKTSLKQKDFHSFIQCVFTTYDINGRLCPRSLWMQENESENVPKSWSWQSTECDDPSDNLQAWKVSGNGLWEKRCNRVSIIVIGGQIGN